MIRKKIVILTIFLPVLLTGLFIFDVFSFPFFLIGERMPMRLYTVPESNRIWSGNNLPPTSTNSNTQAGMVMTTIIRDRTMLSDRITKWARRCFQNRYDCRRFCDARQMLRPKMPYVYNNRNSLPCKFRWFRNNWGWGATSLSIYKDCLKYISFPPPTRLFFRRHPLYISSIKNVRNIRVIVCWKYPCSSLFVLGI